MLNIIEFIHSDPTGAVVVILASVYILVCVIALVIDCMDSHIDRYANKYNNKESLGIWDRDRDRDRDNLDD